MGPRSSGPLVLLVDEHQDSREMYAEYLKAHKFRVGHAGDGAQALRLATARPPDVIVTDLHVASIDGLSLCRDLKQHPETRHVPIIGITAETVSSVTHRARLAGFRAILVKPCLPDQLLREIRNVLNLKVEQARTA
jgi:CheY-like chemotaxis protein